MPYKDPEARRANARKRSRRYRDKHKAKVIAAQKTAVARADGAAKTRKYRSKRSKEFYRIEWLKEQKHKERLAGRPRPETCDICGVKGSGKNWICFDHDHKRGHFRGWLCVRCNTVLGRVEDDTGLLLKMVAYLQRGRVNASPQLALPGV